MGGAAGAAKSGIGGNFGGGGGLGSKVFGGDDDAGLLGVGQFKASQYDVDSSAFKNNDAQKNLSSQFAQQLQQSQNRQAPQAQAAQINMAPQDQFRQGQMGLMQQLQQQANGQGPSLANMQLQQGTDANIRQQMAMGTSHPGMNPALAQRNIMQNAAGAQQQMAQQAAMNHMNEQLSARQQLAGVADQGRGQDVGLATSQAGMNQQANLANQQASLAQTGMNDQQSRFYNTGMMNAADQNQANLMAHEKLKADQAAGLNSTNQAGYAAASASRGKMLGGFGAAIGLAHGGTVPRYMAKGGVVKRKMMDEGGEVKPDADSFGFRKFMGKAFGGKKPDTDAKAAPAPGNDIGTFSEGLTRYAINNPKTPAPTAATAPAPAVPMADGGDVGQETMDKYSMDKQSTAAQPAPAEDKGSDPASMLPMLAMMAGHGGKVPGEAEVKGDSLKNDKVPVMLSPQEVVIPRSIAIPAVEGGDMSELKAFIKGLQKEHKMSKGGTVCMDEGGPVPEPSPLSKVADYFKQPVDAPAPKKPDEISGDDIDRKWAGAMRKSFGGR